MMNSTKRILPIALVAALLGGSIGAFVMRTPKTSAETANNTTTLTPAQPGTNQVATETLNPEQIAFRTGFEEGFLAAQENGSVSADSNAAFDQRYGYAPAVNTRSRRVGNSSGQVYNHTTRSQPQKRSFWQKHRDKLTVAAGAGGGALIGGLIGGKKGALIGGLAGGGGSALYTYKLRKKTPQY